MSEYATMERIEHHGRESSGMRSKPTMVVLRFGVPAPSADAAQTVPIPTFNATVAT
jgi:hypothetical protein